MKYLKIVKPSVVTIIKSCVGEHTVILPHGLTRVFSSLYLAEEFYYHSNNGKWFKLYGKPNRVVEAVVKKSKAVLGRIALQGRTYSLNRQKSKVVSPVVQVVDKTIKKETKEVKEVPYEELNWIFREEK